MAPTSSTAESFWRMILENDVTLITILCPEEEGGKEMTFRYYDSEDSM